MTDVEVTPPKPEGPLRLFLAVELSPEVKEAIGDLSTRLQKGARFTGSRISWVPEDNYHITLYFLGNLQPEVTEKLTHELPAIAKGIEPFDLDVRHLGYFPEDKRPPRVLWIDVYRPPDALMNLRRNCAAALYRAGLPVPKQDFTPHITLARFKSTKGLKAFKKMAEEYRYAKCGKSRVERVTLMRSITGRGPAVYQPYAWSEL